MKKQLQKTFAVIVSIAMVLCMLVNVVPVQAESTEYEIYPTPQKITYNDGDFILKDNVNVVYEDGIDSYTQDRLKEVTDLKDLSIATSSTTDSGKTNILVGIKGSGGLVDQYVNENGSYADDLFDHTDAYYLEVHDGTIVVLGKDTDAAFYGLTTLYMVFGQIDSRTIRNFVIEDYADVASRGFIEGYYGNPWSTEDRVNLMTWGGYYKLNSYFYAPKDDPKHNSNWRELYTEEELESKIKPLAEAGNQSKCRFVFALHPFMYNAISFSSEEAYQADLKVLQDKFEQVINVGVRQIAILADDAANYNNTGNLGGNNYERLLTDMTTWLEEMQKDYPDLKTTIPFCPVEYGGYGESYYKGFSENVQIVMTGGKVWGEVSNSFTSTFTNNVERGPYMWINWPCTDNSKKHLIMGGYDTFLQPGVNPENIQGIVLNPMQQSEPSKVAIFGNACYSWHIWDTIEQANQAWEDSFKYVDHNSALETDASNALKELSKHMINQNMDSRVTALQESVELKEKLNNFKEILNSGTVTEEDIDSMIDEFKILQAASTTYRSQAGNQDTMKQIVYWLDCWDDTTEAAIAYLNGVKAILNNDTSGVIQYNSEGESAFARSKTHGFHYVDHTEYAEVGVQHIVPFINTLATYVSQYAQTAMDPEKIVTTFITNRTDTPVGSTENVFDNDDSTMVSYRSPVWIYTGDYVGVKYNKSIAINSIRFLLGNGKNHFEASKLQYTTDGSEWKDLELTDMDNTFTGVKDQYLEINIAKENLPENFEAMGIRLIATANNQLDAYLNVHEIQINSSENEDNETVVGEYSTNLDRMNDTDFDVLFDSQNGSASGSEVWIAKGSGENKDKTPAGSYIQYTFNSKQKIASVYFAQGGSASGDVISDGSLQYLDDHGDWQTVAAVTNETTQSFDLSSKNIQTTAIRVYNNTYAAIWWRIGEFRVETSINTPIQYNIIKTDRWAVYQGSESNLYDGNDSTFVWYDPDGSGNTTGDDALVDDYIGYDLGKVATLTGVHIVVGTDGKSDKLINYAIETSLDNKVWTAIDSYDNYIGSNSGKDTIDIKLNNLSARYIRIRNLERREAWIIFSEFTVEEAADITGTTDYLYTNIDDTTILSNLEAGSAWLTPGEVTLKNDEYIGLDLGNIRHITAIEGQYDNVQLQVSKNTIEWEDYDASASSANEVDARYIRLINKEDKDAVLTLTELMVTFDYIAGKSVTSDFANQSKESDMRTTETVDNVFDGDLSTLGMITGPQNKGQYIIFDLGQTIHFESIRYYVVETQLNYIRDADFEVSVDGEQWVKVLHVGEETENTWNSSVAKDMQDKTLKHDSSNPGYMYAEATDLDVDGRYIRVTPTSTYSHRWVAFNEIQINGGAYISTESNKDIISDDIEVEGKIPSNMIDKDYTTSYQSSAKNSSFTYYVSEPVGKRTIRIVQSGQASGAKVVATVYEDDKEKEIELCSLNQIISEFVIPEDMTIKEIKVSWEENIPEILEIALYETVSDSTEAKAKLDELLADKQDTSAWTTSSAEKYNEAYATALETSLNAYASKDSLEMAYGLLTAAMNSAEERYDDSRLAELVNGRIDNANNYYTMVSFNSYNSTILSAMDALANSGDLSKEDGEKLVAKIETALDGLEYSSLYREKAQLLVEEELILDERLYTSKSLAVYKAAKEALNQAIEKDKAATTQSERVTPEEFTELMEAYQNAKDNLVTIDQTKETLQKMIDEIDRLDSSQYTKSSFAALQSAQEKAKQIMSTGTNLEIEMMVDELSAAVNALEETAQSDYEEYKASVVLEGDALYTEDSYKAYKDAYDILMNLGDDVSKTAFITAKTKYEDALAALQFKAADYSQVEAVLNKVPADLSIYDEALVNELNAMIASIDYDLTINDQQTVDQYALDLESLLEKVLKSVDSGIVVDDNKTESATNTSNTASQTDTKTGDEQTILPNVIMLMISVCAFLILKRKELLKR